MENSQLPQTQEYARKLAELMDGEPTFRDLDVVEDREIQVTLGDHDHRGLRGGAAAPESSLCGPFRPR